MNESNQSLVDFDYVQTIVNELEKGAVLSPDTCILIQDLVHEMVEMGTIAALKYAQARGSNKIQQEDVEKAMRRFL